MKFFISLSRRVSARKGTRQEQKRMLIFIAGLLFLTSNLPVSNGMLNEKQEAAFCSSNVCYTAHVSKANFPEAQKSCTNKGGNLVTVMSEEEAELVHTLLSELSTNRTSLNQPLKLWIGLKLKVCVMKHELLKGFYWTLGDGTTEKGQFSNWMSEPKSTCTKEMCASMILHPDPLNNFKWVDSPCSAMVDGFICKFVIQGTCQPLLLAGPGGVDYETPFSFKGSSLSLLPFASFAYVFCGHQRNQANHILMCKEVKVSGTSVYQWGNPYSDEQLGALCVSKDLGCNYNNGGCKHKCIENSEKGSISCECNDGYLLAPDLVSCVIPDHCQSYQCEHSCVNHLHGPECTCRSGFELSKNKRDCVDIDECLQSPCNHTCKNTAGSYRCDCLPGFVWEGTRCSDIDECMDSTCSQGCLNTYGSYLCSCNNGYVLDTDEESCLDVDECINSPCEHSCKNIPGSYTCICPKGSKLSLDRISCVPEQHIPNITPTDREDKDSKPNNIETTSHGQRDLTNQPTPSSGFPELFTEEEDKRQVSSPTSASGDGDHSPSNSSVDQVVSDPEDGYSMVLLISILCACGVFLVLLIVAGGFLCYRKRNAKNKETEKQSSATDKYCWVKESENKVNNDYR